MEDKRVTFRRSRKTDKGESSFPSLAYLPQQTEVESSANRSGDYIYE